MSGQPKTEERRPEVLLPAPTPWPLVLALGLTLVCAGLVTAVAVGILGAALAILGAVGWLQEVLPEPRHAAVAVQEETVAVKTSRREVARLKLAPELGRVRLPIEIYPIAAGVRGGVAGAAAMAMVAMAYGGLTHGSVWYPVNLLGAVVYANPFHVRPVGLLHFNLPLFLVASAIHLSTSILVGLLYGAMLPMLPRSPLLLGGGIAPVLWTGLVYSVVNFVNPLMGEEINWEWFIASQVAFGVVAGLVVLRHERVPVRQFLPPAARAGIEATGMHHD